MHLGSKVKHDKEAIQIMKDFVEGKMSIEDFKYQYDNNPSIKKNFNEYPGRPLKVGIGYDYILRMDELDIRKTGDALNLFGFFMEFLEINGYSCTPTEEYSKKYTFLLKIQPSWLDMLDEDYLQQQVISKVPIELTENQKMKWCKERIKDLFRYDDRPPRWIQEAEWPIVDGKPLVFKKQSKEVKDDERVHFYFYDPYTGQETIITQLY